MKTITELFEELKKCREHMDAVAGGVDMAYGSGMSTGYINKEAQMYWALCDHGATVERELEKRLREWDNEHS